MLALSDSQEVELEERNKEKEDDKEEKEKDGMENQHLVEGTTPYQSAFIQHIDSFVGGGKGEGVGVGGKVFRFVSLVLGPVVFLPFLFNPLLASPAVNRCAGVTLWMAIWWMSEAIPISFTALVPLVLFPLLGIVPPEAVSSSYFNDLSFLFIGTVMFACAMERWNFHKRFALKILLIVGTNPGAVLAGFMSTTYFLSWWLSNSATTALMLPVVRAVLENIHDEEQGTSTAVRTSSLYPQNNSYEPPVFSYTNKYSNMFSKATLIAVAYSASIGGISTLTGTATNLVFAGQVRDLFPNYGDLSFAQWMLFAAPLSLILMIFMWTLFYFRYLRHSTHRIDTHTVRQRYNALGKISFEEIIITILLVFTIILWLLREPPGCSECGWQAIFSPYASWYGGEKELISDGTVVLFTVFLMFFIPAQNRAVGRRILEWDMVLKQLPWDVLLLLGGGFALSEAFSATHFTDYIAARLTAILLLSTIVTTLTEFTSNAAVASIMLPIVASTAVAMRINPLFLMVPTCISCSFAFCLPVATPCNAMVFGMGVVSIKDLVKSGMFMNIFGVLLNVLWMLIAGGILGIDLDHFPSWAEE